MRSCHSGESSISFHQVEESVSSIAATAFTTAPATNAGEVLLVMVETIDGVWGTRAGGFFLYLVLT